MSGLLRYTFCLIFSAGACAAFAQSGDLRTQFDAEINACRTDEVCTYEVLVGYAEAGELRALAGQYAAYSMTMGAIRASIKAPEKQIGFLDAGIVAVDGFYQGIPGYELSSAPLHLYRAEACRDAGETACFDESAAVLLQHAVASRASGILRAGLEPPFTWSQIADLPATLTVDSPYRWSQDLRETAEHDPRGTDFDRRIADVLAEAERRMQ